jgi:hypothetical protein
MSLLTDKQLRSIQKLGEQSFKVSCVLYKKLAFAKDLTNPYGDSDIGYAASATTFKGWLVPTHAVDFTMGVSQVISSGNFRLRVPIDLDPDVGDKVVIDTQDYFISESTKEQTWPEWITCRLRRIQG